MAEMSPEDLATALAAMTSEQRAAALGAMSPVGRAQALGLLSCEERAAAFALMDPEEIAAAMAQMDPKASAAMMKQLPKSARDQVRKETELLREEMAAERVQGELPRRGMGRTGALHDMDVPRVEGEGAAHWCSWASPWLWARCHPDRLVCRAPEVLSGRTRPAVASRICIDTMVRAQSKAHPQHTSESCSGEQDQS